jgi:hypothetical protein
MNFAVKENVYAVRVVQLGRIIFKCLIASALISISIINNTT